MLIFAILIRVNECEAQKEQIAWLLAIVIKNFISCCYVDHCCHSVSTSFIIVAPICLIRFSMIKHISKRYQRNHFHPIYIQLESSAFNQKNRSHVALKSVSLFNLRNFLDKHIVVLYIIC